MENQIDNIPDEFDYDIYDPPDPDDYDIYDPDDIDDEYDYHYYKSDNIDSENDSDVDYEYIGPEDTDYDSGNESDNGYHTNNVLRNYIFSLSRSHDDYDNIFSDDDSEYQPPDEGIQDYFLCDIDLAAESNEQIE